MTKIILFGATGYSGRLTAAALLERGLHPLLVGRDSTRLQALSAELGGLDYASASAHDGASLRRLLGKGDVLVSTVGPFWKLGALQVEAALAQGAHYVDSCGEPAFFRSLWSHYRIAARRAGSAVLTACAYDFFPGNAVADHVLQQAGPDAVRVDIGYFGAVAPGYQVSAGSRVSGLVTMLEPGLFWRGGRYVLEPLGIHLHAIELDGEERPGISMAGTEHLFLPELYPALRDINGYWGWAGRGTHAVHWLSRLNGAVARHPRAKRVLNRWLERVAKSDGSGPDHGMRERSSAYVCAAAYDADGRKLASAQMGDSDGFSFTAKILAWTADSIARDQLLCTGVTGPVQAFGRERLRQGHAEAGFDLQ